MPIRLQIDCFLVYAAIQNAFVKLVDVLHNGYIAIKF